MSWHQSVKSAREFQTPRAIYGIKAISDYFGVPPATITKWIHSGFLPAMRDPSSQWFTTIDLISQWILAASVLEVEAGPRRLEGNTAGMHPRPDELRAYKEELMAAREKEDA